MLNIDSEKKYKQTTNHLKHQPEFVWKLNLQLISPDSMYFLLYHQISLESFLLKNCFLNVTKHDFINYVFVKGFKDVQRACGNKYGNS